MWLQRDITLRPRPRGFHLVTDEVLDGMPEIAGLAVGLLHLSLQHTSAAMTLNENASPDVRRDMERWVNSAIPEAFAWSHTLEGPDDMPAHVKSSLMGATLTLALRDGRPVLGTWQGIHLCEHRDHGGARRLTLTAHGEPA